MTPDLIINFTICHKAHIHSNTLRFADHERNCNSHQHTYKCKAWTLDWVLDSWTEIRTGFWTDN